MSNHVLPIKTYVAVFVVLMVLLVATVAVSRVHLGDLNVAAALAIAFIKTFLVAFYFMHVRSSHRLIWVFVGVGLVVVGFIGRRRRRRRLLVGEGGVDCFPSHSCPSGVEQPADRDRPAHSDD